MIKHFLSVFSPPAKSSSNLCRHKLIRSAEILQTENSFKHTCLQPTHMVCCKLKSNIKHIHSIRVHPSLHLMACWRVSYNTWATIEVGELGSTEHGERREVEDLSGGALLALELTDIWAQRLKPKKLKRRTPPLVFTVALLPAHPPLQPSTDQHMWWRMTHLFFYKGCVYVKLLKCIKMSSTLGGPPRLPWKITRWKYNFSAGEPGIWTEFCLSLSLSFSPSVFSPPLRSFSFFFCCMLFFFSFA